MMLVRSMRAQSFSRSEAPAMSILSSRRLLPLNVDEGLQVWIVVLLGAAAKTFVRSLYVMSGRGSACSEIPKKYAFRIRRPSRTDFETFCTIA